MKTLLVVAVVSLMGCDRVFGLDRVEDPCECDVDAGDCPQRCLVDAGAVDGDGALTDAGAADASADAETGCTTNVACSSMVAGTCCVDPGPTTGHCEVGTVLGGGFCYVP